MLELLGRFELPDVRRHTADILSRSAPLCSAQRAFGTGRQFECRRDAKNRVPVGDTDFLELLGRFELPTSSLPNKEKLIIARDSFRLISEKS